jgi:hypothetical protein
MNPALITALLRATNDDIVPAPCPGEDTHDYRLRCAMAGASVTLSWLREQQAAAARRPEVTLEDPPMSPGRPDDVTVTSPPSPDNPYVHANGRSDLDEIGVD